jgi:tetratricopeptide (TPR) repeat protein
VTTLPENIALKLDELSQLGNDFLDQGRAPEAISTWEEALEILPEPKINWEASEWLYASIGDAYYELNNYKRAQEALQNALNCSGSSPSPFVTYRLGQVFVEQGQTERGVEMLLRAYMLDGDTIFVEDGGEKYLDLIRQRKLI